MQQVEEKVSYNGYVKCYTTLTMGKEEAKRYSYDNALNLRCQQPCGFKWWYFHWGEEVDADLFYNN
jgi:hypothetical protein